MAARHESVPHSLRNELGTAPAAIARSALRADASAGPATPVGLRPPYVAGPAEILLILIDAPFSSCLSRGNHGNSTDNQLYHRCSSSLPLSDASTLPNKGTPVELGETGTRGSINKSCFRVAAGTALRNVYCIADGKTAVKPIIDNRAYAFDVGDPATIWQRTGHNFTNEVAGAYSTMWRTESDGSNTVCVEAVNLTDKKALFQIFAD